MTEEQPTMNITILFLGPARDLAGMERTSEHIPERSTVNSLRRLVSSKFPKFGTGLRSIRVAVNRSFVSEDHELGEGDEVALIPPVSGG